jgi:antitoxin VapB
MFDKIYTEVYILYRGDYMQTAKIFQNGRSQAVRLPKEFQFRGNEVYIQKHGDAVLLFPHEKLWEIFIEGINEFSDDFMDTGREQGQNQERQSF